MDNDMTPATDSVAELDINESIAEAQRKQARAEWIMILGFGAIGAVSTLGCLGILFAYAAGGSW